MQVIPGMYCICINLLMFILHNLDFGCIPNSLAVTRLQDVPYFGPPLPEKGRFKKTKEFREFLLTKRKC